MRSSIGDLVQGLAHEVKAIDVYDVLWPPLSRAVRGTDYRALYYDYVEPELMARPGRASTNVALLRQGVR
jgi:hypothetical protein